MNLLTNLLTYDFDMNHILHRIVVIKADLSNTHFSLSVLLEIKIRNEVDCWPDMPDLNPPGECCRHTLS